MVKLNKDELLRALQADLKSADTLRKDTDDKIQQWKAEYNGDAYGNEVEGKSKIVSRDIKKQSEWQHAAIIDPFVSSPDIVKISPITAEDVEAARQKEIVLNAQFCRKFNRYMFMTKAVKVLDQEGTVVIQTGWDYEDEEVEVEVPTVAQLPDGSEVVVGSETVVQTKVVRNMPTATVCRNEDIFIDPTCMDDMDKCQFVIHRYETDLSTLKQDGRYKNLKNLAKEKPETTTSGTDFDAEDDSEFRFTDDPRKKLLVHEYWGNYDIDGDGVTEPIVCAWVNDTVIRLELNPYPDNKPPFIVVPFNSVPFQMYGESNAELISDNQKVKTAITRGIIDNMAQSNNGQKGIRKGALDVQNRKKFLTGKNFEFNGTPNDFWDGSYNSIPASAFNMLSLMNNEIESVTGTKSFSGGMNGSSGLGNMLDIRTDIPLIDGSFKKLMDIEEGDQLVGSNGRVTEVLAAHPIKMPKVAYDMHFSNTSVVTSGGEHLWTVKCGGGPKHLRTWTTMCADDVYALIQKGYKLTVPRIKEIHNGNPTGNNIDPYVLGFWLGDGMSHTARITTADDEVLEFFDEAGYVCREVKDSTKCGTARMYEVNRKGVEVSFDSDGNFKSNSSFHSELRELGLLARYEGGVKHIPEEYFTASYEEKMELIRGLMDSDGYAHSGSFVQFAQSEGRLKDDVIRLVESLGLKTSIRVKYTDTMNKQKLARSERTGTKMIWARKNAYEIGFTPWSNPFKLSRKANKWQLPRIHTVRIDTMKIVDLVPMRCLTVDSDDKLFAVTDKFTLTHNTATAARGTMDSIAMRRMNTVRNISENLIKPLMRKWIAYDAEFLEDEEVVRYTDEEFVTIRKDDLGGYFDMDISVSTAEDNNAKSQELSFMMQTMGQSMSEEMRFKMLAQWADLTKQPALAKEFRSHKPEVDPLAEEMKKQEVLKAKLENAKLKAEIEGIMKAANEDGADTEAKMAKARLVNAQAAKVESERDMIDLKFVKEDEQIGHQEKMEIEEAKHKANMQSLYAQKMAGDKNLGVIE